MSTNTKTTAPDQVDVRGPRFAAWVTTAVLVVTLLVVGLQPGRGRRDPRRAGRRLRDRRAGAGPVSIPYGLIFATLVAPRLGPGHRDASPCRR